MTEPLGHTAGAAALEEVDPAAWLSEKEKQKCLKDNSTNYYSIANTQTMGKISEITHRGV